MRIRWLLLVLTACVLIANVPLAMLAWTFSASPNHDFHCLWRVAAHNPNQYLFLALFLPVITACVYIGWCFLKRLSGCSMPEVSVVRWARFRRFLPVLCGIGGLLALGISVGSVKADEPDYSEFDVDTQCAGARSGTAILERMNDNPPSDTLTRDVLQVPVRFGVLGEPSDAVMGLTGSSSSILLKSACSYSTDWIRYHLISIDKLAECIPFEHDPIPLSAAVPTVSMLLYRETATRLEASRVISRFDAIIAANAWELGADLIIAWALLLGVAGTLVLRPVVGSTSDERALHRRAVYALLTADSLFYVWIAFRAYSKAELQILNGGRYEAIGDVAPVLLLVTGVAIFLLSQLIDKKWLDYIGAGYPVVCGIVTVAFAIIDPVTAGRAFGSLAAWQSVALLATTYLILLGFAVLRAATS